MYCNILINMFFFPDIILHTIFFQNFSLLKSYVSKIQELEGELLHLQSLNSSRHSDFVVDRTDLDDDSLRAKNAYFRSLNVLSSVCDTKGADSSSKIQGTLFLCPLIYLLLLFCLVFFPRKFIVLGGACPVGGG